MSKSEMNEENRALLSLRQRDLKSKKKWLKSPNTWNEWTINSYYCKIY